ncbi:MAG: nucleoside phosphorylase [Salibacteraceae bacterium]
MHSSTSPTSGSRLAESELILNTDDGSIYHLILLPEHLADDVIVVGDPGRVKSISDRFDSVDVRISNREFVTHTGWLNGKRITALATGSGTDNIDIVLNELDALVIIDLESRRIKADHKSLNIVRIGTTGALQGDFPVDSYLASRYGLGFDNVLHYYQYHPEAETAQLEQALVDHLNMGDAASRPYLVPCSNTLLQKVGAGMHQGITATAPGFYGPQGRTLRLPLRIEDLNERLSSFENGNLKVTNFEMETSALYGLGHLLGHQCCTVCLVIANRIRNEYSKDYHPAMGRLIDTVLERLTQ